MLGGFQNNTLKYILLSYVHILAYGGNRKKPATNSTEN